jgi:hypothetical protein
MVRIPPFQRLIKSERGGGSCSIHGSCIFWGVLFLLFLDSQESLFAVIYIACISTSVWNGRSIFNICRVGVFGVRSIILTAGKACVFLGFFPRPFHC